MYTIKRVLSVSLFNNKLRNNIFNLPKVQLLLTRNFGIADSIMNMATSSVDKNKEKQFAEMISLMSTSKPWTYKIWSDSLKKQLSSWTMYIPGVSSSPEVAHLKVFSAILEKMTEDELNNKSDVNGMARERLAKTSGKTIDEVNKMVFFYKQSLAVATWLQLKVSLKEKIPKTDLEMNEMQEKDHRMKSIATKIMKPPIKTGRGRKMPF